MIVWINGAFGSGKTTIAQALANSYEKAHVYDPEQVGYFLWDNFPQELKEKENFQHLPMWRSINVSILSYLDSVYDGILIVPMTLYEKRYYEEIITTLRKQGVILHHYILDADKETLLQRLNSRGEGADSWPARHIDICLQAFEEDITETKIATIGRSIEDITAEIRHKAGV